MQIFINGKSMSPKEILRENMKIQKMGRKGKDTVSTKICWSGKSTHVNTTVKHKFLNVNKSSITERNEEYHKWNISQTAEITENEQDETKEMDETYELSEPKTPQLRKMVQKQRNVNKNNLNVKSIKKHLKVRFKDPMLGTSIPDVPTKTNSERNLSMSSINIFRKRTNPVSNEINSTVDPKFLATKKVPNFAEIHKRMFNKLESVVDAKKRLENRHTALTTIQTNKPTNSTVNSDQHDRLLDKLNKSPCNQLGFKIKKREATECILRNSSSLQTRSKVQQQNRAILKGVRTNRRFELQMKARNLVL